MPPFPSAARTLLLLALLALPATTSHSQPAPTNALPDPSAVAADGRGGVWVASAARGTVTHLSAGGTTRRVLRTAGAELLRAPAALAAWPDGTLAVLDTTARRLHLFDADAAWTASTGRPFQHPTDLAAWPDGTLAVADPATDAVYFFDAALHPLGRLDASAPTLLAAAGSLLATYDADAHRLHLWRGAAATWTPVAVFDAPPGPLLGLAMTPGALFVTGPATVERLSLTGQPTATLPPDALGEARLRRPALDGARLVLPDAAGHRLLVADTALTSPRLYPVFTDDGFLALSWQTPSAHAGHVAVFTDDGPFTRRTEATATRRHRLLIPGIQPSTRYDVRYGPLLDALPPDTSATAEVTLMAPPPPGQMHFMEMQGAVLLFTRLRDPNDRTTPAPPGLSQLEISRIIRQLEDARRFFWLNAGLRLHLDLHYYLIEDPMPVDAVFAQPPGHTPRAGLADSLLARFGTSADAFDALFLLAAAPPNVAATPALPHAGETFTDRLGNRLGRSWWRITPEGHPAGNNWLLIHAFQRQLADHFAASGYPRYGAGYFAPEDGLDPAVAEHADDHAARLRTWPAGRWFALRTARLRHAPDADGDGLPDAAPALPADEARLGSNPGMPDTDGDGRSDYDEVGEANWLADGLGVLYGGPARFPKLNAPDTDGDLLHDADDPYPLVPYASALLPVDAPTPFPMLGQTTDRRVPFAVRAAWSADSLFVRILAPPDRRVRLLLDANADGWRTGHDNLAFDLPTTDAAHATGRVLAAPSPEAWPRQDDARTRTLAFRWRRLPGAQGYQLSLARTHRLGLLLEAGERLGLQLGVSATSATAEEARFVSLFEPHRFVIVALRR